MKTIIVDAMRMTLGAIIAAETGDSKLSQHLEKNTRGCVNFKVDFACVGGRFSYTFRSNGMRSLYANGITKTR